MSNDGIFDFYEYDPYPITTIDNFVDTTRVGVIDYGIYNLQFSLDWLKKRERNGEKVIEWSTCK